MNRLLFAIPLILAVAVFVYFYEGLGRDASVVPSALINRPAPEFDLPPLKDDKPGLKTADLKGKVALVNVFASWCVPCRAEHPMIRRLAEEYGIPVYAINYKDKREDALKYLDELGDPYERIGFDSTGRVGIDWGVYGVPETYVIDRNGIIRFKHVGPLLERHIKDEILPLVEKLSK